MNTNLWMLFKYTMEEFMWLSFNTTCHGLTSSWVLFMVQWALYQVTGTWDHFWVMQSNQFSTIFSGKLHRNFPLQVFQPCRNEATSFTLQKLNIISPPASCFNVSVAFLISFLLLILTDYPVNHCWFCHSETLEDQTKALNTHPSGSNAKDVEKLQLWC